MNKKTYFRNDIASGQRLEDGTQPSRYCSETSCGVDSRVATNIKIEAFLTALAM